MTESASMPFCKGCGHTHIINKLNDALIQLKLDPKDICLVTDIGCIGLSDALFDKIHTVHTTHGRSTAFATGVSIADKVLAQKKLKVIVLIGDGGSMIGLLHIVNGALLNTDVTVLVCNNFLFGMTGGQQSSHSPENFITQTTPHGNIIPPLDICGIAGASKAEFIARKSATDKDLADIFAKAIAHDGFSLVEVLELCTEHAVTRNELKGNMINKIAEDEGHEMGILKDTGHRKEFSMRFTEDFKKHKHIFKSPEFIVPETKHNLTKQMGIIIAGSAGEKVQSSAAMLCQAALQSGLHTTQKNDNPVTQGSGFSLSEVIISPEHINYTGVDIADVVIILSGDGLKELESQNIYDRVDKNTLVILDESLNFDSANCKIVKLPFRKSCGAGKAVLGAVDYFISSVNPFTFNVFKELLVKKYGDYNKIFRKEFYEIV
jgi:pyruvate/2-oxoacid:ferredoxin oxidoreductase beta subunit/Pyruvate/2-oxoacid:ferredoxin oxidoreductase gamma subunit